MPPAPAPATAPALPDLPCPHAPCPPCEINRFTMSEFHDARKAWVASLPEGTVCWYGVPNESRCGLVKKNGSQFRGLVAAGSGWISPVEGTDPIPLFVTQWPDPAPLPASGSPALGVVEPAKKAGRLPVVYVAAPLSQGDQLANISAAMRVWDRLSRTGVCIPICPHWSALQQMHRPRPYEDWLTYDLALIETCVDAVLRVPGDSSGADREVTRALDLGLPVFQNTPGGDPLDNESRLAEWCKSVWPFIHEKRDIPARRERELSYAIDRAFAPLLAEYEKCNRIFSPEITGTLPPVEPAAPRPRPVPFVIGLRGLIGSGKTTVADHLVQILIAAGVPATVLPFAHSLKNGLAGMGITKTGTPDLYRSCAQSLGTDLVRKTSPDHWIRQWQSMKDNLVRTGTKVVVVDDVRFENEAALCDSLWYLHDDGFRLPDAAFTDHPSERFNRFFHSRLPTASDVREGNRRTTPFAHPKEYTNWSPPCAEVQQNMRTHALYIPRGLCRRAANHIAVDLGLITTEQSRANGGTADRSGNIGWEPIDGNPNKRLLKLTARGAAW